MRNISKVVLGLLICSFASCVSTFNTSFGKLTDSMNLTAGPDESEIIIKRPTDYFTSSRKHIIIIDGQPRLELKNGSSGKIIVKNGQHTIYAEWVKGIKTDPIEFTAESSRITFKSYYSWSTFVFVIEKESEFSL